MLDSHKEVRHFRGSSRDQEEGGELDSLSKKFLRVQARSRGELDPQVGPEEIISREVQLGL